MKNYDLEGRTKRFSKSVIILCKKIPSDIINKQLVDQLLRSSMSIGANYREANQCNIKEDFKDKIIISKKEVKKTIYWLELLIDANPSVKDEIHKLLDKSKQLMRILTSIYLKTLGK